MALQSRSSAFALAAQEYRAERHAAPTRSNRPKAAPIIGPGSALKGDAGRPPRKPLVGLISAASIKPKAICWMWNGWLAQGKLHILGGSPGTGKTTLAMSFAATVTRGGTWPDGTHCPTPMRVVIWSGEDDPQDTLVPRLIAAGADLTRVVFVGNVKDKGETRHFDLSADVGPLREAIMQSGGAGLIVVDPIVSAVAVDSHRNTEVRRALQPLVDLASDIGAVVLGITHFSKGTSGQDPLERLNGSIAFGAMARVVMVVSKREAGDGDTSGGERILCRAKSNVGADDGGFGYDLFQTSLEGEPDIVTSSVRWRGAIEGTAREILADADFVESEDGAGAVAEAKDFLIDSLSSGPKAVRTLAMEAKQNGHSWPSFKRAKRLAGINSKKVGKGTIWYIPGGEGDPTGSTAIRNSLTQFVGPVEPVEKTLH